MDFRSFDRYIERLDENYLYYAGASISGTGPDDLSITINFDHDLYGFLPVVSEVRCDIETIRGVEYLYVVPIIEFPTIDPSVTEFADSVAWVLEQWYKKVGRMCKECAIYPYYDSMFDDWDEE